MNLVSKKGVNMSHSHAVRSLGIALVILLVLTTAIPALAFNPDTLVSVGSPSTPFSQNKQNEPALAVDANHPNILAAGSNDNIDMEACNAGDDTTCPFTADIGGSGIYFSFDSGSTWIQPTYTGLTARFCLGVPGPDAGCTPQVGPIGTLPKYYENGLVSDGDAALAFGPVPGAGGDFSWANGSRLYYANLTSKLGGASSQETFKGFEAIAVSRTDDVQAAAAGTMDAWMDPVIDTKQGFGRSGCTVRTDSNGVVYVFADQFAVGMPGQGSHVMIKSFDGGHTWTRPVNLGLAVDTCFSVQFDGTSFRCVMDGIAGARDDLSSAPSVDIANGAPTGDDATNEI